MKKLVEFILIITIALLPTNVGAGAASLGSSSGTVSSSSNYEWMNEDMTTLQHSAPFNLCIEVPNTSNIISANTSLNLNEAGTWIPTGLKVKQGLMLGVDWNVSNVSLVPRKYKVMYRIDPRFSRPQIFIQAYNPLTSTYESDFNLYNSGVTSSFSWWGWFSPFANYGQSLPIIFNNFVNYFNFSSRPAITVNSGDVVNISLSSNFFSASSQLQSNLGTGLDPAQIYTQSPMPNNQILYTQASIFCNFLSSHNNNNATANCSGGGYIDPTFGTLLGVNSDPIFASHRSVLPSCSVGASGNGNTPMCYYDKGRGMQISVAGNIIKPTEAGFIYSEIQNKYLLYYQATAGGTLGFSTSWAINGMYDSASSQLMSNWASSPNLVNLALFSPSQFPSYLQDNLLTMPVNFMHFGLYTMDIEIGSGSAVFSPSDLSALGVEYLIQDAQPDPSDSGTSASQTFRTNASSDGYVWIRVTNSQPNRIGGSINANVKAYNGATWASGLIYGDLIQPLRAKFNSLTEMLYIKLTTDPILQRIGKLLLTIYVALYGLMYLVGSVRITTLDLSIRVMKVGVIIALFSENSWTFFNNNLFNMFVSGSDYLMTSIAGNTSQVGNVFGFMDPIINTYTNPNFWALLAIQLLQFWNGLTFIAMLTMYSMMLYLVGLLEVIVSYCLAFLGLSIMISLAPFFILMLLFEQTKGMFFSWLSTIFQYMLQPTILLIFFLLVNQVMEYQLQRAVAKACWGVLIPLHIFIPMGALGNLDFTIPFFPGIPFFIPRLDSVESLADLISPGGETSNILTLATTALLFYALAKLSVGIIDYVTLLVSSLTNTMAATSEGKSGDNPINDVISDLKSPFKKMAEIGKAGANKLQEAAANRKGGTNNDSKESNNSSSSSQSSSSSNSGSTGT